MVASVTPPEIVLYTGSTTPVLRTTIRTDAPGNPHADLSGAIVSLRLRRRGARFNAMRRAEETCVIVNAPWGVVDFIWPRALTAVGEYVGQFVIIWANGKAGHSPLFTIHLGLGA